MACGSAAHAGGGGGGGVPLRVEGQSLGPRRLGLELDGERGRAERGGRTLVSMDGDDMAEAESTKLEVAM